MVNNSTQAELAIANPEYAAAITISALAGDVKQVYTTVMAQAIADRGKEPLVAAERTLTAQLATLDAVFNHLVIQATSQSSSQAQADFFDLALAAQAQCRETIATLSQLKPAAHPPVSNSTGWPSHYGHESKPTKVSANDVVESSV
jgi:hypothetical protein